MSTKARTSFKKFFLLFDLSIKITLTPAFCLKKKILSLNILTSKLRSPTRDLATRSSPHQISIARLISLRSPLSYALLYTPTFRMEEEEGQERREIEEPTTRRRWKRTVQDNRPSKQSRSAVTGELLKLANLGGDARF